MRKAESLAIESSWSVRVAFQSLALAFRFNLLKPLHAYKILTQGTGTVSSD